jgi:hypothetical protein
MFGRFLKEELWHGLCSYYNGIGLWFSALYAIFGLLLPTFDLGSKMNAILAIIPFPYRLLILFGFIFISVILTWYWSYKKQQTFFEDNVQKVVKHLNNNVEKLDGWFEYIKASQRFAFQELRRVIFDEITPTFIRTDKSIIDKSIGDLFPKILLYLNDVKPKAGEDIKTKYDSIQQLKMDIVYNCPEDSSSQSEQAKLIAPVYTGMFQLKKNIEELATALQDCATIIKAERK